MVFYGLLAFFAGWNNSATNDEPYHLGASYAYVVEGKGDLNPEHPPLAKLLSGFALSFLPLTSPPIPPVERIFHLDAWVHHFLYENRVPPLTLLRVGRSIHLLFFVLLLWGTYKVGCYFFSQRIALFSILLLASQPLVLAHTQVVHTDVPVAAFFILSLWRLLALRHNPGISNGVILGLFLGAMLTSKFSSIFLLLFLLLSVLIDILKNRNYRILPPLLLSGVIAFFVLLGIYALPLRNQSLAEENAIIDAYMALYGPGPQRAFLLKDIASLSKPLAHYLLGISYVQFNNMVGQGVSYLAGYKKIGGFILYFPVACLFKVSFPLLIFLIFGLMKKKKPEGSFLFLILPVLLYFFISAGASYNIGARHLMPILPLLALWAARGVRQKGWMFGLLSFQLLIPLMSFPHYLAHFNYALGGRWVGEKVLIDSNLDWGQDWFRMAKWMKKHHIPFNQTTYLYIGSGDPSYHMPGSQDLLTLSPKDKVNYFVSSLHWEKVGVETLYLMGFKRESRFLARWLDRVHREGRIITTYGGTLRLYGFPGRAEERYR